MGIVQMKNDAAAGAMNMRGERDGELGPIVNPHNIPGPQPPQQRAEDGADDPAMEEPGQVRKVSAQALIELQPGNSLIDSGGKFQVSSAEGHTTTECIVAQNVGGPTRDRAADEFGEWLSLGKKMISGVGHLSSRPIL